MANAFQNLGIAYTAWMRRLLLTAAVFFSTSAFAGESDYTIKVIQDDGSVAVIDLRESAAPIPEPAAQPERGPIPTPRAPKGFEGQASAPPVSDKEAVKPAVKATQKKVVKKTKRKAVKASPPGPKFAPRQALPGAEITPALAMSIAIDHAPPSSDVEVFRSEYKDQPAFAVVFKTDEGFEEVLVHSETGKVLKVRRSETFDATPKPGHLPAGLR